MSSSATGISKSDAISNTRCRSTSSVRCPAEQRRLLDRVGELVVRDVRAPDAPRGVGDEGDDGQLEDQL